MLRHLLFWLLPPITLYFLTYTYFRQFWVKSQRSITLNYSKTRNGRVHICHSTPMLKMPPRVGQLWFSGASQVQKTGRNIITVMCSKTFWIVASVNDLHQPKILMPSNVLKEHSCRCSWLIAFPSWRSEIGDQVLNNGAVRAAITMLGRFHGCDSINKYQFWEMMVLCQDQDLKYI